MPDDLFFTQPILVCCYMMPTAIDYGSNSTLEFVMSQYLALFLNKPHAGSFVWDDFTSAQLINVSNMHIFQFNIGMTGFASRSTRRIGSKLPVAPAESGYSSKLHSLFFVVF